MTDKRHDTGDGMPPARTGPQPVSSAGQAPGHVNRLGPIMAGLLLAIFVSAIDNTVVSTAMGTIVATLGGLDQFVWVTAGYMVTEMAGMPIFGKLSDMYGRKRFFLFGLALFILASMLCGTAHSIAQLSLYRALQGIGGGALAPVAFTIIFDVMPPDKAGRFSGMFGAVFGAASIIGPLLGAYITDHFSWRWVFYINLPLGIVSLLLVGLFYHESRRHARQVIDWLGTITLVPAVACLMFALQLGGQKYPWSSTTIVSLFIGAAVLFALFLWAEARAPEPIVSYAMFRNRLFAVSNLVGLLLSAAFVVAVVYIPIYIQGVQGGNATNAGLTLLPMMLGSSIAAPLGSQLSVRFGYRPIMLVSGTVFMAALIMLTTLTPNTPHLWVTVAMVLLGVGLGPSFSVLSMASMHPFGERQRGAASATLGFVRELGMTVSITVYGIMQRNQFADGLKSLFGPGAGFGWSTGGGAPDPRAMLSPAARAHIPGPILQKLTDLLTSSITHTFVWTLTPAVLALVLTFWFGRDKWAGFRQAAQAPAGAETTPVAE